MEIVLFSHSLLSDWNHGNAHFLRGVVTELVRRGHAVRCYEARDAWSVENLVRDHGEAPFSALRRRYPDLDIRRYDRASLDLDRALDGADLVWVHEWNDPALVAAIGDRRKRGASYRALFHDTHHRSVSAPEELGRYDLSGYDGVLVFGRAIADVYERRGWGRRVWTWHEAADQRVFRPLPSIEPDADLVWIGNWGDDERTAELRSFLVEPCRALELAATVHGVRYPEAAVAALEAAGIAYRGWLANFRVPLAFARHRVTVHVPRRFYRERLPGIPTIRPFEALACGIPLVSAPWSDLEGLFRPGRDFLVARDGAQMRETLREVVSDAGLRQALAESGRERILARHTCAHRVDELLEIARAVGVADAAAAASPAASA
jgi:spore maturation protein CgeB